MQNAIKTAATHGQAKERVDRLEGAVQAIRAPLVPGGLKVLKELVDEIPNLREKTRVDTTKNLEKVTGAKLQEIGQSILTSKSVSVATSDVEALLKACACFSHMPGCKEIHVKLTTWTAKYVKILATTDLIAWCTEYTETARAQPYAEPIPMDVKHLSGVLSKCPSPLPESLSVALSSVFPAVFERLFLQAPDGSVSTSATFGEKEGPSHRPRPQMAGLC